MDSESKEQTQLLRNIWNQIKEMNTNLGGRIDALTGRVDVLSDRVDALGDRVGALGDRVDALGVKIDETNGRLDNLIKVSSRWYWDLERRVRSLEDGAG